MCQTTAILVGAAAKGMPFVQARGSGAIPTKVWLLSCSFVKP